jgi:hypothetical protein
MTRHLVCSLQEGKAETSNCGPVSPVSPVNKLILSLGDGLHFGVSHKTGRKRFKGENLKHVVSCLRLCVFISTTPASEAPNKSSSLDPGWAHP